MSEKEVLEQFGFEPEEWEEAKDNFVETGFPIPVKRFRIESENFNMSIEEPYFWMLNYVRADVGYVNVKKTIDVFSAAENSAFFGVSQLRLGGQQEKISQFLATIGKMTKELFQLVRELRIIDERMGYYRGSWGIDDDENTLPEGVKEADEITLKGIWIDMVQGGAKNPGSIFGLAREVGFTSLPDLFFSTHPRSHDQVDNVVDTERGGFNKSVRNVLKRQLNQYLRWKEKTYDELKTRRAFTLQYLRQHYGIIRMYMTWVRPYLRHVRRLTLDEDKILSPDMVSAFEGSVVEVEFLAYKLPTDPDSKKQNKDIYSCILSHFLFRTRPSMSFQQEGYQRGPIHVGTMQMNLRVYTWTKKQIEDYTKMKDHQDFELMKSISESVKSAMEALGGELERYLEEAGEQMKKKEEGEKEGKKEKSSFFTRFKSEFIGTKPKTKKPEAGKPKKKNKLKLKNEQKLAVKIGKGDLFLCFKNYKKAHRMIMW